MKKFQYIENLITTTSPKKKIHINVGIAVGDRFPSPKTVNRTKSWYLVAYCFMDQPVIRTTFAAVHCCAGQYGDDCIVSSLGYKRQPFASPGAVWSRLSTAPIYDYCSRLAALAVRRTDLLTVYVYIADRHTIRHEQFNMRRKTHG